MRPRLSELHEVIGSRVYEKFGLEEFKASPYWLFSFKVAISSTDYVDLLIT